VQRPGGRGAVLLGYRHVAYGLQNPITGQCDFRTVRRKVRRNRIRARGAGHRQCSGRRRDGVHLAAGRMDGFGGRMDAFTPGANQQGLPRFALRRRGGVIAE
jgi:hypothetical protein